MRPEKLVISAFGPYAGQIDIDFNALGENGLYLISGNTGAGKSTIFDAIRFALYGDDSTELRSKYAEDATPTFVELWFVLHGKEYQIRRNPKYLRPKTRGEGFTEAKADGEMTFPDGRVVTGYAGVTQAVTELTGLNGEQFSKIVMIAQGKFRELLVADTANRSKIFRDIFKTSSYDTIQRKVKNRFLEVYREYGKVNDSIKQYVQGIRLPEEDESYDRIREIMAQDMVTDTEEITGLLNALIEKETEHMTENTHEVEECQRLIQQLSDSLLNLKSLHELLSQLIQEKKRYDEYDILSRDINDAYEREMKRQPEREKLLVQIEKERTSVEKYKIYDDKLKEADECKENLVQLTKKYEEQSEIKEKLEKQAASLDESLKETESASLQLVELEAKEKDNIRQLKSLNRILDMDKTYRKACEDYDKYAGVYVDKKKKEEAARGKYDVALKQFLDAQAGIMAETLRENPHMPCPVCGSTNHVKLAVCPDERPSEDDVDKLKKQWERASSEAVTASQEAGAANKAKEKEYQMLLEAMDESGIQWNQEDYIAGLEKTIEELKAEGQVMAMEHKRLCDTIAHRERLKEELKVTVKKQEENRDSIKTTEDIIHEYRLKEKALETQLDTLREELTVDNRQEAEKQLRDKEDIYRKLTLDLKNAADSREAHMRDKDKCQAVVGQLSKQIEAFDVGETDIAIDVKDSEQLISAESEIIDIIEKQKQELQEASLRRQQITEVNNQVYARVSSNKDIVKNIVSQKKVLEHKGERLKELKALSDTLNGEVDGKEKIKLETFVQISYFEQVINKANVKLFEMTEGQYEFVRDMSGEDKRSKSGLELNVYDHYNGSVRSVRTLSGGEGFMASLSLALGMADIIEESASGIAIDTMFIDEGFGSLDEASLEQAMRVLAKLSDGNKLVGIISHVGGLRDRIDRQINVVKGVSGGSSIRITV